MRLFALLALLLILQLAIASYYDAETCGIATLNKTRDRRSLRSRRTTDEEEEEEEETEEEEEEATSAGIQKKPEANDDDTDDDDDIGNEDNDDESMTEKVMGGMDAKLGELPWAVRLQINRGKNEFFQCGGTLISKRHVLTAAHCFRKTEDDRMETGCKPEDIHTDKEVIANTKVFVGAICFRTKKEDKCNPGEEGEERKIVKIGLRQQFLADKCHRSMSDVAILELDRDVSGPHACLPHLHNMDTFTATQTPMTAFGFGSDPVSDVRIHKILQKVELGTALDKRHCQKVWKLRFDEVVCTRESSTKNVCQGDSGGGILAVHSKRTFLVGVISFGFSCADSAQNAQIENAQVNMDIDLYSASIDKFIGKQTPNIHGEWKEQKM